MKFVSQVVVLGVLLVVHVAADANAAASAIPAFARRLEDEGRCAVEGERSQE